MSVSFPSARGLVAAWFLCVSLLPMWPNAELAAAGVEHIVVSEVMTGGASASDELIELYNPSAVALPLEGLELVYVTATGATVSRRAAWDLGAPELPPGSHLLVAHELGIFASIADAVYASGMAATGGSVALRIQGAASAIDAVGWGTATGSWLEGTPAPAAPAGSSLERVPGGAAGSTDDTDDNAVDFVVRAIPDPQNSGSPPVPDPAAPTPTPSAPPATPSPTPTTAPAPTPTASVAIPIATARALPDGVAVSIEGTALTGSDFHDGGGYLADESGGIAVLVEGGSFALGERLVVSGVLDDRFAQRTIRAAAVDVSAIGAGDDPAALPRATAAVDESVEGRLVRIAGSFIGSPSALSGALAFDVDDGSGAVRIVVGDATGIDTAGWTAGRGIELIGVVGQRDSSGSGASGYRVQPRSAADVLGLVDATPSPAPSGSTGASSSPSPSAGAGGVSTVVQARAAERNERLTVRGVVTLPPGVIDPSSAVIQDATGAILLRLGPEVGRLPRGQLVEVEGVRSTKSGMESLRVSRPARRLGKVAEPQPRALRTGDASEAHEARVVVVRGALVAAARRASSRAVSFEIDDGSGPLRVVLGASLRAEPGRWRKGVWVEVRGVLGQETSGSQPLRGYRVWPRTNGEVRVTAPAASGAALNGGSHGSGVTDVTGALAALDGAGGEDLRIGATLVASEWSELGIAGLLWDGDRLVAIAPSSDDALASAVGSRRPPISLELSGMREIGSEARLGIATVVLGAGSGDSVTGTSPPHAPTSHLPARGEPARWVTVVGRSTRTPDGVEYRVGDGSITIERACDDERAPGPEGVVSITGVALANGGRVLVPCAGIRPASQLALAGIGASSSGAHAGRGPDRTAAAVDAGEAPHRVAGIALFAIAAAGIVGAAMVRHRLQRGPDAIALDPGTDADQSPAGDPAPERPHLTLVPVPRERGP